MAVEYSRANRTPQRLEDFMYQKVYLQKRVAKLVDYFGEVQSSFDIDQTDVFTVEEAINIVNKVFGLEKTVEDLKKYWGLEEFFSDIMVIKDRREFSRKIWNSYHVGRRSKPVPGALETYAYLAGYNIFPYRITSRPAKSRVATLQWYAEWMPKIPASRILIQKCRKYDPFFKPKAVKKHDIRVHFDDYTEDLEAISKFGVTCVLVPQKINEGYELADSGKIVTPKEYIEAPAVVRSFLTLADVMFG